MTFVTFFCKKITYFLQVLRCKVEHILLNDFTNNQLKYLRTIENLDSNYFTQNSEGKVNFGLYAEAAHTMTFKFFDMECLFDKESIETKFPEIIK